MAANHPSDLKQHFGIFETIFILINELDPKKMQDWQTLFHPRFHASLATPNLLSSHQEANGHVVTNGQSFSYTFEGKSTTFLLYLAGLSSNMGLSLNYRNVDKVHLSIPSAHND